MATKYFCDGCGDEHKSTALSKTDVLITVRADYEDKRDVDHSFDLCSVCLNRFRNIHLPNKWSRTKS